MSDYKCEFCSNEYTNKKILKTHQKTAKFCIEIQKRTQNKTNNKDIVFSIYQCEFCKDSFTQKGNLERHYGTCEIKIEKMRNENEQKNALIILKLNEEINNYKEEINNYKDEINNYRTEILVLKKELKMKDEMFQETKETYNSFLEKEEKLVDTLLQHNSSIQSQPKTINNNLIVNNYGIKPFTNDVVLEAFETYNLKNKRAFNCYVYNILTGDKEGYKIENVLRDIAKELKDYYGITDVSREKIIYNKNGEILKTTASEFIKTNVVMNNVDAILDWISNLITQIYKKIEDGYNTTQDGIVVELTEEDKKCLLDKKEGLSSISNLFESTKKRGNVNICLEKYMKEEMIKNGKIIEKEVKKLK